jgi:hypothetical protein
VTHRPLCAVAAVLVTLPITLFSVGLVVARNLRPFHLPLSEVEITNFVARLQAIAEEREAR